MAHPRPETIERLCLRVPGDFTRDAFRKLMLKAHMENGVSVIETVYFLEPHASGLRPKQRETHDPRKPSKSDVFLYSLSDSAKNKNRLNFNNYP
jgi:hypothetical protein